MVLLMSIRNLTKTAIRTAEKITGLDVPYFFKGGFWMSITQIAFILSGIALSVAFTRLGDKALYGKYQFVIALAAVFMITTLPGTNTALMQAVSRGFEKTFSIIFKQKLLWSLLGTLGLFITAGYFYFIRQDLSFGVVFVIAALHFPFLFWNSLLINFFFGKGDFARANYYLVVERILVVVAVCIALFFTNKFIIIILVYYFISALTNCVNFARFKTKYSLKKRTDTKSVRYGWHLTWMTIIPKALVQIDKILIPAFLGIEALAVYVIAIIIPDMIENFMGLMHMVSFKKLVFLKKKQILPKLMKWWVLVFFVVVVGVTVLLMPFAITLLYGADYQSSIRLGQMYALMLPAIFLWKFSNNWRVAHRKTKAFFYFSNGFYLVSAALIAGSLWLMPSLENVVLVRVGTLYLFALFSFLSLRK